MFRSVKLTIVTLLLSATGYSQNFLGYTQDNFAGINRFDLQPASIADNRLKYDLTVGGQIGFYNNFLSMKASDMKTLIFDGADSSFLENSVNFRYNGDAKSAILNWDVHLPSFMITVSDKAAIAFTAKFRTFINVDGLEEPIAELILSDFDVPNLFNMNLTNERASVQNMMWAEYGIGYGRVVYDNGSNFVKVGGRLKFLQGIQAAYMYVENFRYNFSNEDSISIFQSDVRYGHSDSYDPSTGEFKYTFDSKLGIGLDLGVVYEWRPDWEEHKYDMDGREDLWKRYQNKYKLRVGASLLDVGSMKFKKGGESGDFRADVNDWNIRQILSDSSFTIDALDDTLLSRFERLPSDEEYFKMNLPTAINLDVDYMLTPAVYVNASAFLAFQFRGDRNAVHHFSNFSLTPRFEIPQLGAYLPLSYSRYAGFRAGLGLRLGPLVIGTSDIRAVFGASSLYGADVYAALKIPIAYKAPKDKDGDAVSDKLDECPDVAGVWVFQGCPDTDGDLIPDEEDECPVEAGLLEFNGCPDTDRDGIRDRDDECPMVPGLAAMNGCPDTDGDGIKDSEDVCPGIAGLAKFNGCPDTDDDGVEDAQDNCPTEPGPATNFGCPEKVRVHLVDEFGNIVASASMSDNGGFIFQNLPLDQTYLFLLDGVDEDVKDQLSLIIRNADGDHDIIAKLEDSGFFVYRYLKDGEATTLSLLEEEENTLVLLEEEQQQIVNTAFDNLQFATGLAVIKKESYAALNELTKLLVDHPDWKILLEGHTDNVGSAAVNLTLSKKRAESVKLYLISQGVNKDNIIVKYYGQAKPIGDNSTEAGRAKNRRVEMSIVNK